MSHDVSADPTPFDVPYQGIGKDSGGGNRCATSQRFTMVSAVSADIPQVADASTTPDTYHWFKMPDLNRATHRSLGSR